MQPPGALAAGRDGVDASALPLPSTATHRRIEGQLIARRSPCGSAPTAVFFHAPSTGAVEVRMLPRLSTAMHSELVGQAIARSPGADIDPAGELPGAVLAGAVEARMLPLSSTAAHSEADPHERRSRASRSVAAARRSTLERTSSAVRPPAQPCGDADEHSRR